jgi:hypothetical protein
MVSDLYFIGEIGNMDAIEISDIDITTPGS